ncbi:hypothetical protein [Conexibacter sp. W3-3-2]|uniref:hypothetical protein n=1 Tax=Conexibacter sp. W3-3-2 TaxID=2675227 RepID=UPI001E492C27|nr:hypothetical protein [Conexibacter sp. W3-3-2]
MPDWTRSHAARIAATAVHELEALVGISSPSGDRAGAERCVAALTADLPADALVERLTCSTAGNADDLLIRVPGTGSRRIVLVGHVDTVISHELHQPLHPDPDVQGRSAARGRST